MTILDKLIAVEVDGKIDHPLISPKFGDMWKNGVAKEMDNETLINIAWRQGRRAILLERLLKRYENLITATLVDGELYDKNVDNYTNG